MLPLVLKYKYRFLTVFFLGGCSSTGPQEHSGLGAQKHHRPTIELPESDPSQPISKFPTKQEINTDTIVIEKNSPNFQSEADKSKSELVKAKRTDQEFEMGLSPSQADYAPSYILGIKSVQKLFYNKDFEDALIEVNELLRFYPKSTKLLMMKGTLHKRLGNPSLALKSYEAAFALEPSLRLEAHIEQLKNELKNLDQKKVKDLAVDLPSDMQGAEQ